MAKVLIAGGSGLVGRRLSEILTKRGYEVAHLSRTKTANYPYTIFQWDIRKQWIEDGAVEEADYVINLAGAGIVDQRWTDQRKKVIIESRTESTRLLLAYFKKLAKSPKAYISAAAIGYYGERGNTLVNESSAPGEGFLAESCMAWENAIKEVADSGIRTAWIRIGIVMSKQGGAMPKMLIPFYFFMGSYFGNGQQWYSWIHIDDLSQMFIWAMENQEAKGAYNGVSPQPLTNKDLTIALGKARNQFFIPVPAPAFILRLAMGEMSSTILNSTKVASKKIEDAGFKFEYPEVVNAMKDILKRDV
ncbi:MAG: TIGR01777 family oxidoreductase [Saprospiraceae bacterium]|nr:TIGR01777 family oxidoreductase [Saprospiraceae bacterium]